MAMQIKGPDGRLYNPDRDLLWALPRITTQALARFGKNISVADVRKMLLTYGISFDQKTIDGVPVVSDDELFEEFKVLLTELASFANDLKDKVEVRRNCKDRFIKLFSGNKIRNALRALVSDAFMSIIYGELHIWFDSVQPEKANSPAPAVEEVTSAVRQLFSNEGSSRE